MHNVNPSAWTPGIHPTRTAHTHQVVYCHEQTFASNGLTHHNTRAKCCDDVECVITHEFRSTDETRVLHSFQAANISAPFHRIFKQRIFGITRGRNFAQKTIPHATFLVGQIFRYTSTMIQWRFGRCNVLLHGQFVCDVLISEDSRRNESFDEWVKYAAWIIIAVWPVALGATLFMRMQTNFIMLSDESKKKKKLTFRPVKLFDPLLIAQMMINIISMSIDTFHDGSCRFSFIDRLNNKFVRFLKIP